MGTQCSATLHGGAQEAKGKPGPAPCCHWHSQMVGAPVDLICVQGHEGRSPDPVRLVAPLLSVQRAVEACGPALEPQNQLKLVLSCFQRDPEPKFPPLTGDPWNPLTRDTCEPLTASPTEP